MQHWTRRYQSVGISPLKVHVQSMSGRINLGKRKLNTAISTIQEKIARVLNLISEEINLDTRTTENVDLLRIKAENFDRLMQLIKEKLSTIKTNREIIQVPTLAPETWSVKKVANFISVTEYAAGKAKSLAQEKGTLALPDKKKRKNLSEYTVNLVKAFYEDNEFSQQMPGKNIMLVFPAIPTNKKDFVKFKWTLW